jgi:hypothetical protein
MLVDGVTRTPRIRMIVAVSTLARRPLDIVVVLALQAGIDAVLLPLLAVVTALFMESTVNRLVVAETRVMCEAVVVMSIASVALLVAVVVDVARLRLLVTRIPTCLPLDPSSLNGTIPLVRV